MVVREDGPCDPGVDATLPCADRCGVQAGARVMSFWEGLYRGNRLRRTLGDDFIVSRPIDAGHRDACVCHDEVVGVGDDPATRRTITDGLEGCSSLPTGGHDPAHLAVARRRLRMQAPRGRA